MYQPVPDELAGTYTVIDTPEESAYWRFNPLPDVPEFSVRGGKQRLIKAYAKRNISPWEQARPGLFAALMLREWVEELPLQYGLAVSGRWTWSPRPYVYSGQYFQPPHEPVTKPIWLRCEGFRFQVPVEYIVCVEVPVSLKIAFLVVKDGRAIVLIHHKRAVIECYSSHGSRRMVLDLKIRRAEMWRAFADPAPSWPWLGCYRSQFPQSELDYF